jgi:hypothetical protein
MTLNALKGNELPKTEEEFEAFRDELVKTAVASQQFIGNEEEITDAINSYLSSIPQFEGYYSIPLENELDKVDELLGQADFSKTKCKLCIIQLIFQYTYFFRKNFCKFEKYSISC